METIVHTDRSVGEWDTRPPVTTSLPPTVATSALTLALLALGAGLGLSSDLAVGQLGRLRRDLQGRNRNVPRAGGGHVVGCRRLSGRPPARQMGRL